MAMPVAYTSLLSAPLRLTVPYPELGLVMGSPLTSTLPLLFGAKWSRWIGVATLIAYVVFLVLGLTTIRKI